MTKDAEKRAELVEHLAELRTRLVRSFIYVVVGATAAWFLYEQVFSLLTRPMADVLTKIDAKFLLTGFPEAFLIRIQICVVSGLILVLPLVTTEVWGFISPGLTREERRAIKWIAPLSTVLFAGGVVLCYTILPMAFKWFASYVPPGAELRPSVQASVLFTVKMLLAFGVVFELPIVLMLLAKVGIVDSRLLRENWRVAMLGVTIVAAVATPSGDAFSMMMMAVPVAMLYFMSILLVKMIEGKRRKA